ncbi:MAG: sigma 54-interacting transcriptional regulator [Blastocatellia bacterium]
MTKESRKNKAASLPGAANMSELIELIDAGRRAAADADHETAIAQYKRALQSPLLNSEQQATVRCSLAESLENLARYQEAIVVLAEYEIPARRAGLHPAVQFHLWLRMGSAYGYAGDHPRAISYLKSALGLAGERQDPGDLGACHLVLGRIYRAIGETEFSRDHLRQALQYHRALGQWRPLAQTYQMLGNVCVSEGDFPAGRDHFEQGIKIIGTRRAPLLLGSLYSNLSSLILWREQGQPTEAIEMIEKAISNLKEAKNERILAYAWANIGHALTQTGEWARAEEALQQSLELGSRLGDRAVQGTALDSLGEIYMLRGDYGRAEDALTQSVAHSRAVRMSFGEEQALQTLGRCLLLRGEKTRAIDVFNQELAVALKQKDKRLTASARLHLAEACLETGDEKQAHRLLDEAAEAIELSDNVSLVAHFRLLSGLARVRAGGYEAARHHLGQAVTIYEMISHPYQEALARYHQGFVAIVHGPPEDHARGVAELEKARELSQRLGATPLWRRTETILGELRRQTEWETERRLHTVEAPSSRETAATPTVDMNGAAALRLLGASSSRGLLLQELAALLHETAGQISVIVYAEEEETGFLPVAMAGVSQEKARDLAGQTSELLHVSRHETEIPVDGATLLRLRTPGTARIALRLGADGGRRVSRQAIEPLLRLAEMCLELCALREHSRGLLHYETAEQRPETPLPGLVLASQAMQKLGRDIQKIRGSHVTALVTGESGTGKELVARAIHQLSERRNAPFIPFNCTVTPREIIASQLFGHRKGAFTGAVADYRGMIRSADTGTLFLDEIGDLSLDVQPQLLRFLQEGEIQPLGEMRPVRVDVRVIAATNADIEKLVSEGKFREDLYYRLNIIRLHIPPLRERREEIPALIEYFLAQYATEAGMPHTEQKPALSLTPQALDLLMVYDWPGNVRQLANEIQRLVAYASAGGVITERDLSPQVMGAARQMQTAAAGQRNLAAVTSALLGRAPLELAPPRVSTVPATADALPLSLVYRPGEDTLGSLVDELERRIIGDALRRHSGHRENAAREMGITRKGLYLKLQRLKMVAAADTPGAAEQAEG